MVKKTQNWKNTSLIIYPTWNPTVWRSETYTEATARNFAPTNPPFHTQLWLFQKTSDFRLRRRLSSSGGVQREFVPRPLGALQPLVILQWNHTIHYGKFQLLGESFMSNVWMRSWFPHWLQKRPYPVFKTVQTAGFGNLDWLCKARRFPWREGVFSDVVTGLSPHRATLEPPPANGDSPGQLLWRTWSEGLVCGDPGVVFGVVRGKWQELVGVHFVGESSVDSSIPNNISIGC